MISARSGVVGGRSDVIGARFDLKANSTNLPNLVDYSCDWCTIW